ncbi:iron ABC transporter substrate-binding protein, partial [Bradyrhizobium elkanii]
IKEKCRPVATVYAAEGSPRIVGPIAIFGHRPRPNTARLVQTFALGPEGQQLYIEIGGLRSVHAQVKEKAGRRPLKDIKTMKDDPAAADWEGESMQARLRRILRV